MIYLSHTQSHIAYADSVVSCFMCNTSEVHMIVYIKVLWYLYLARWRCLVVSMNHHTKIMGYCDSYWGAKGERWRSTIGFIWGKLVIGKLNYKKMSHCLVKKLNTKWWLKVSKNYYGWIDLRGSLVFHSENLWSYLRQPIWC